MQKKVISLLICAAMIISTLVFCMPVNAATTGSAQVSAKTPTLDSSGDFTWDNANVYFLLTDRFNNGNTSNDHSYGRATDASGKPLAGWDTAPGTFHGGDFAGITQKINEGYFDDLGVNAIWLSAPYEQIHGYVDSGSGSFAHYSYHGYYVLDYTETDANFGTKEEFQTLVDTAHKHGIRIVMDIVMNHTGYNTIKDMEEFNYGTLLSGASDYKYMLTNVSGLNDHIDFKSSATDWGRWWGNDWIRSGLPGYTEGGGELEMCLLGLPDFRTESTKQVSIPPILQTKWTKEGTYNQKVAKYGSTGTVSDYIVKWLSEWVSTYGVDGFRCDTAKHVELGSWNKLKQSCVTALETWRQNNPDKVGADWDEDFWMTGEAWGQGLDENPYYSQGGFDSMINFSFSGSGVPAINSIDGVYQKYASEINNKVGFNALTYISSHDSNLYRGDLVYQGSAFQLMPGAIQIFYGDETNRKTVSGLSFDGNGGSGHSLRSDMNWSSIDKDLLAHWQKVGQFRKNHVAVGAGSHSQISAYNQSTGYTFSRSYDDGNVTDNIIAVISAPANKDIAVDVSSIWYDGLTVTNAYDGTKAVVTNGKATFNSGKNGTILIEGPQSTISMSIRGIYSFLDSQTLTVSLRGADYAMVSIKDGTPFRVVNGSTFEVGEGIELGEVFTVSITATNEEETAKKTFTFKRKDPSAVTTIYFDNSKYNWSTVNAYIYDESSSEVKKNAAWPGQAMDYNSNTGLYELEVPDGLENGNVMFNAGEGSANRYPGDGEKGLAINGTNMIFSYGNKWEPYNGQIAEPTTAPDPTKTITVYFDNSSSNFQTPYVYFWSSKTNSGPQSWPGIAMTKYKDNIWTASFSNEYDMCIFSNNGGNQTGDLSVPGNGYLYANGNWSQYYVEPTTAKPEPTTVKPEPTTVKPEPTTVKPEPTTVKPVTENLVVKATSNVFPETSSEFNKDTKQVVVTYKLDSTMDLVNSQWTLTYDPSVLAVTSTKNVMPHADGAIVNKKTNGVVKGNFSSIDPITYSNDDYVKVTFDVISTGNTTVNLDVEYLSVGYISNNKLLNEYIVDKSQVRDISGISGFSKASISGKTSVSAPTSVIYGDVNGDGKVTIDDVTVVQKNVAELLALDANQLEAADVDHDGEITILDVTLMQKYIANMISEF